MYNPSRYLAHQWILDQKVKSQGHRVTKCITSRRDCRRAAPWDGPARLSRRAMTQPRRSVLLKAIEWPASVIKKVKVCHLYSASSEMLHFWSAQHGSHSFIHCKYVHHAAFTSYSYYPASSYCCFQQWFSMFGRQTVLLPYWDCWSLPKVWVSRRKSR